ncbi:site-specific integrase [Burkholderia cepacia]|uniref:Site-specific integrase n=2 Tax=Burkholderia cepacia TaxID=292 RepID=A0A2S8IE85_BURCE|nr:site-specific integrase [Burkholderia cepacia]HDR9510482.1 site-specific integrase [Burkholderia cepacia]
MRFVRATEEFVFAGRPRSGFPLLLDESMEPAQPFHDYLLYRLLERGKALDPKTWEAYGRRLWDFARFLQANDWSWNDPFMSVGQSVVRVYRDWQAQDLKLDPATVNDRLRLVAAMYQWAHERGRIDRLPFSYSEIAVNDIEHDLAHVTGGRKTLSCPDVLLNEWDKEPAFLTVEQLKIARQSIRSASQRLLFDLMARVGLRSVEARTFPLSYVFDPSAQKALKPGTFIDVRLDPRDMEIKLNKARVVHVPYSLMEDMYAYATYERNGLIGAAERKELVLTIHGQRYSKESAVKVYMDLSNRLGFRVRPLMLRHSYAIHTLLLLRSRPEIKLEPLMYVRDRLGHASVQTTMVYLQQIERLLGAEALAMMGEFDRLYGVSNALASTLQASTADPRY